MKQDLVELLRGTNLKSEIYKTISRHKFGSTTRLRHTLNTHGPQYLDFKSEDAGIRTEMGSPGSKTELSLQKLSKSVNQAWSSRKKEKKEGSRSKECKLQRTQKSESKSHHKVKSKSQILSSRKVQSQQSHYPQSPFVSYKPVTKTVNMPKRSDKKQKKQSNPDNSSFKSGAKELESIIEQSSSDEQLITPDKKGPRKQESSLSNSKTKKKQQSSQNFSQSFKRKIEKSFKEPDIFQKILKTQSLTISYRILKKRLIQIEMYTLKPIEFLSVTLEKGSLQCQSINEQYKHVSANTVLALFSSVRSIDIERVQDFPRLKLEAVLDQGEKVERNVLLPYTWLHFVDQKMPCLKKSKIKTKICLCDLPINTTNLKILSDIFPHWLKKGFKGHSEFETGFILGEQEFSLKLLEEASQKFSLEIEGKGQARLIQMIEFLQHLIC